jgi:hydroxymethylbilane synthase
LSDMITATPLRIGTRSSPMALAQAARVVHALHALGPSIETSVVPLKTSGDRWQGDLAHLGGKGAFVRDLDVALLAGNIDVVVHCLKDIPGDRPLPEGLTIAAYLERDDVRDAVISRSGDSLDRLPRGAVVGTSSARRRVQLQNRWPELVVQPVRGNANTRLAKLDGGEFDALVLAVAGLERIEAADRISAVIPIGQMLPAVGAGVLVIVTRSDDTGTRTLVEGLDDQATKQQALAERSLLFALSGHCQSPIAALATTGDGTLQLRAAVYSPDGAVCLEASAAGDLAQPEALGKAVAALLLEKGARELIDAIPH